MASGCFHGTQGNNTVIAVPQIPPYITTSTNHSFLASSYISLLSLSLSLSLCLSLSATTGIASSPVVVIRSHLKAYDRPRRNKSPRSSAPLTETTTLNTIIIVSSSTNNCLKRGNAPSIFTVCAFERLKRYSIVICYIYQPYCPLLLSTSLFRSLRLRRSTPVPYPDIRSYPSCLASRRIIPDVVGRAAVSASF